MFDPFAHELFELLPELPELTPENARRMLTSAYLNVIRLRIERLTTSSEIPNSFQEPSFPLDGGDNPPTSESPVEIDYLRRLADTMEFYAVLEEDTSSSVRRAGAFITAESLALLTEIYDIGSMSEFQTCRLRHNGVYTRIEAAILYLIAGYDANASGVVSRIPSISLTNPSPGEQGAEWGLEVLVKFCQYRLNPLPPRVCPVSFEESLSLNALRVEDDTIGRLYGSLGEAVSSFMGWLTGEFPMGMDLAEQKLRDILTLLGPLSLGTIQQGLGGDYARLRHLAALLSVCLPLLHDRSLLRNIPPGTGFSPDIYSEYLKSRAKGYDLEAVGRPVLWPSAKEYVDLCMNSCVKHTVVSMPTGSGKSFIAELAISQSIGEGWALYLAPTNALTEQIRNDLEKSLRSLHTQVLAFVGGQEYSVLRTDVVSEMEPNSVAVMTPEKASLALRLYPEVFSSCRLLVFDECHLLGDKLSGRGITAELILSRLMLKVPDIRIMLISAIVQNPEDLADWLKEATGYNATVVRIPWRPTRTLRSALGIDYTLFMENWKAAKDDLAKFPDHRKNLKFESPFSLVCGLQGAWQSSDELDYGFTTLPCNALLKISRKNQDGKWQYFPGESSWVNASTVEIASFLAESGIQTLAFIPASRHYPFSNARNTQVSDNYLNSLRDVPPIVKTCRILAEYEFGVPSVVFELLDKGIAVHTAGMIETEKIAAEVAFKSQSSRLMYATATLAQGLNMPATAVVIAGTRIGFTAGVDEEILEQRRRSQLLNAAGRAGRAGFSNQGLVVAVPDKPISVRPYSSVDQIRSNLRYLQLPDNAVAVESCLDSFLDHVAKGLLSTETADPVELQTVATLSGGDIKQPEPSEVLRKSYASFRRKKEGVLDVSEEAGRHLIQMREEFLVKGGFPDWIPKAAQRAGLDYSLTVSIYEAWNKLSPHNEDDILDWSVFAWTEVLLKVIANVSPSIIQKCFPDNSLGRISKELESLSSIYKDEEDEYTGISDREPSDKWIQAWVDLLDLLRPWMQGRPLNEIAAKLKSCDANSIDVGRNSGNKPIPATLTLINDSFARLSLLAGGLVAIAEDMFEDLAQKGFQVFQQGVPNALNTVPLCIKYGCDSPRSLAWYRFGIRLRRPARLLYEVFPPPQINDDVQLSAWVKNQRKDWLRGDYDKSQDLVRKNDETLKAIAEFLQQDSKSMDN